MRPDKRGKKALLGLALVACAIAPAAGIQRLEVPAAEVALKPEVVDPEPVEMTEEDGTSYWTVPVPPGLATPLPVKVAVVISSRLGSCLADPAQCSGEENFAAATPECTKRPGVELHGCVDEADNDGDGLIDRADPDCTGVLAWSYSVVTDACFNIGPNTGPLSGRGATTTGTLSDLCPLGYFRVEVVTNPNHVDNAGRVGAVSMIHCCFSNPEMILPPVSDSIVLFLRGKADVSRLCPGEASEPCTISIVPPDGRPLVGSGEPVETWVITSRGETLEPQAWTASIRFQASASAPAPFVRSDANQDGEVNIADAVAAFNKLFRASPLLPCRAALDTNDDEHVDLSDVIYLLIFLYQGGPAPPPPFTSCGQDPSPGPGCREYSSPACCSR